MLQSEKSKWEQLEIPTSLKGTFRSLNASRTLDVCEDNVESTTCIGRIPTT